METVIREYLGQIRVGPRQSYKNLALFPLLSTYRAALDYVTLDEAFAENLVEVAEVGREGSVPEIKVTNKSPRRLLILDGEELVGAKQNRIVNTTILLEALSTTVIPVSCVEQGRWSYKSDRFHTGERLMCAELRAMKVKQVRESVRRSGAFRSDQGALWQGIGEKAMRMKAASPSMAMSDIYEKEMPSLQEYVKHFSPVDAQIGAALTINGRIAGLDSFGKPETLSGLFRKLVESYALDALDRMEPEEKPDEGEGELTSFLKESISATVESRPSVALGTDCRMVSPALAGSAFVLDGQVLHLSMFAANGAGERAGEGRTSRMQRPSARRRNRE